MRARAGGVIVQTMADGTEETVSRVNSSEREMIDLKVSLKGIWVLKVLLAEPVKMLTVKISAANTNSDHIIILVFRIRTGGQIGGPVVGWIGGRNFC